MTAPVLSASPMFMFPVTLEPLNTPIPVAEQFAGTNTSLMYVSVITGVASVKSVETAGTKLPAAKFRQLTENPPAAATPPVGVKAPVMVVAGVIVTAPVLVGAIPMVPVPLALIVRASAAPEEIARRFTPPAAAALTTSTPVTDVAAEASTFNAGVVVPSRPTASALVPAEVTVAAPVTPVAAPKVIAPVLLSNLTSERRQRDDLIWKSLPPLNIHWQVHGQVAPFLKPPPPVKLPAWQTRAFAGQPGHSAARLAMSWS